ncbi:glycoside hydrolase superfamily [Mycena rebaudengoi]|nr:glycoside hydrolase superfamily [Mycena rebaudengoi]
MYCHILIALLALSAPVHASTFYQTISRPHHNLERPGIHLRTDTSVNVSGTDRVASGCLTTNDLANITVSPDPSSLSQFVAAAQVNKVKAILSIGGWTGSHYYSRLVNTSASRTKFVNTVLGLVTTYTLDGIDFDSQLGISRRRPQQGLRCNERHLDDSANFLLFLQELRGRKEGKELILTAAIGLTPFSGMPSVAEFAKVLDYIAIMVYDVWGAGWLNTVGPNAPLYDSGMPLRMGSAASAVTAWTSLGFPANYSSPQITLGVAAYGRSYFVDPSVAVQSDGQLALYPNFDHSKVHQGNADDPKVPWVDPCGDSAGNSGEFTFESLISGGYLDANGHVHDEIYYNFDHCVGCSETLTRSLHSHSHCGEDVQSTWIVAIQFKWNVLVQSELSDPITQPE